MSFTVTLGETVKTNNGSYRKFEITVNKDDVATQENLNQTFAECRSAVTTQKAISEKEGSQ